MKRVTHFRGLSPAERLLKTLGVIEPNEIDLDAIAYDQGVEVIYRPLDGCEAQIAGVEDRAAVVINQTSGRKRRRFSLAHELGHWHHHRGKTLACRTDGERHPSSRATDPERVADEYAADLLMPGYLFKPLSRNLKRADLEAARKLSDAFDTSLTATLIRLVELGPEPAILVCHSPEGRKWFARGPDVPRRWFPKDELDPDSYAMDVLYERTDESRRAVIGADAWFDRREAERFEVFEQSIRTIAGRVLSLVVLKDGEMLEE